MKFPVLMYHRVVTPHCPVPDEDLEESRYAVPSGVFERHLDALVAGGQRGVSMRDVHERLDSGHEVPGHWVAITFDDGNLSDVEVVLPALTARGFSATMYVCGARIGVHGGLEPVHVESLVRAGLHVGSHGMTHRFLSTLTAAEETDELTRSRDLLEEITGSVVDHFSPPGGRYSRRTLMTLGRLGYRAIATSDFGFNACRGRRSVYRRIPVVAATTETVYGRIIGCRAGALWPVYLRHAVLGRARRVLGETMYSRVRRIGVRR